jgi:hypothetical protein
VSSSCPTGTTCAPPRRVGWRPPMGVAALLRLPPNHPEPLAAVLRPNPEILTDTPPPPTPSRRGRSAPAPAQEADHDLLEACGITDLDQLARQCVTARQLLGKATARWTARCLAVVIKAGCGDQRVATSLDGPDPPGRCPGPRKPLAGASGRSRNVVGHPDSRRGALRTDTQRLISQRQPPREAVRPMRDPVIDRIPAALLGHITHASTDM